MFKPAETDELLVIEREAVPPAAPVVPPSPKWLEIDREPLF